MKTSKRSIFIGLILMMVMLLGISMLTACNDVRLDKLQNEYGIVVDGGDFEEGSALVSNEIAASTEEATQLLAAISDQNYDKDGNVYIFDIYVMKDGVKVQPNSKAKVSIPIPNVQVDNYLVFHVKADNSVENLVPTVADGKISFETSSFSYFIIAEAAPAEHEYGAMYYAHTPNFWEDGNIAYYQCSECKKYFDEEYNEVESVVIPKYSTNLSICVNGTPTALVIAEQSDNFIQWSLEGLSVTKGDVITLCQTDNAEISHNYFASGNVGEDGKILNTASSASVTLEATPNGLMLFIDGSCADGACVYDEGVVTKEPTHFEEGIKTYTCTVCGKTKEEPIEKTSEHSFGDWTPDQDDQNKHYRECACGEVETADCVFDANGTCTVCGREKTKVSGIIIVISGGTATFVGKETVTYNSNLYGKNATVYVAQKNDVLNVTLNDQNGRVFKYWASATGTIIPDEDFSMLVQRSGYYYPVFEDVFDADFANYKKVFEGNCEEGTLYMSTNSKGDIKYELEFANYGRHDLTACVSYNDQYHKQECVICGEMIFEEHTEESCEVEKEPTHTEEGIRRYECSCGHTWTESIPTTQKHNLGTWDIVQESKDGQYGKYRVHCTDCDYYEEYWYLDNLDFVSFIDGKMINYKYTYGLQECHDEYYYSYTNADGQKVYIWAFQYEFEGASNRDKGQTFIFMYVDDGDPKTIEPIYLSKSYATNGKGQYIWAIYGYAYDVNDWVAIMGNPDLCIGCSNGMFTSNLMSARVSLLEAWHDYWAILYNKLRIPTTKDYNDLSDTGWEIDYEGTSASNGRACISYVRDKGTDYAQYITVDKATGITIGFIDYATVYTTVNNMYAYKNIVSPEEYEALDDAGKAVSYSCGDIEQGIKSFCAERNTFNSFTLTVPEEASAFRFVLNDPTNSVTLGGSYQNFLYNPAQVYDSGSYITFTWDEKEGIEFDRYEIWDFANQEWVLLYKDQDLIINSTTNPLKESAYIRTVYHEVNAPVDPSVTYTITVNDGYFEIGGDKYVGTVEVAKGTLVNVYAKDVAGKTLDHWLDGNGETFSEQSFYVTSDITLSPVYKEATYYFVCTGLASDSSTPYVSVNGEKVTEYFSQCKFGDKFELSTSQAPESECTVFVGWYLMIIVGDEQQFELVSYSQTITYEITDKISMEQYGIKQIAVLALWTTEEYASAAVTPTYVDIRVENGFVNYSETPSAPSDNAYSSISVSTMGFATFFDNPTDGTVYTAWDVAYRYEINGEVQHYVSCSYEDEYDYYPAQYWVNDPEYSYPDGVINVTGITESSDELE